MDYFNYQDGRLYAEQVAVNDIAAQYGTPCYIYSRATLERHWHAFDRAFRDRPHLVCFAVKANSNLAVLNVLARLGCGFDIVSVGELERVLAAGGDPDLGRGAAVRYVSNVAPESARDSGHLARLETHRSQEATWWRGRRDNW